MAGHQGLAWDDALYQQNLCAAVLGSDVEMWTYHTGASLQQRQPLRKAEAAPGHVRSR